MSSKKHKIYTIKLNDWIFADPKFSKKYTTYLPVSRAFLSSKKTEKLSAGEFKLMISMIEDAYNYGRSTIEVSEKFVRSQGKVLEKSLLKLNDFGYLDILINKEIKEGSGFFKATKKSLVKNGSSSEDPLPPTGLDFSKPLGDTGAESCSRFAHDQIAHVWSFYCESQGLSKVVHWTKERTAMAKKIAEKFSKEQLELAAQKIAASNFCRGENDRGWKANIDFFLNEKKIVKLLEGFYDNRPTAQTAEIKKFVLEE